MLLVCLHREAAQGGLSLRASSARHRHYYHTPATHIRLADPSIKGAKKKGLTVSSPSQTSHFAASKTSTARKAMIGYGAVIGLCHALRAIQTTAFSRRPPDNKKPRGCGGRSPRPTGTTTKPLRCALSRR